MAELTDHELLTRFACTGEEAAFATLVTRHVNLVWSAARRFTGDDTLASEVTQAVFIILAQKAGRLSAKTVLTGWLYQTARLTAANALKENRRRQQREHQAYMEATLTPNETNEAWQQLAPVLDEAMHALRTADRDAVLLRFFENKTLADVGAALGVTEDAARVRVNRALDKLRALLAKQGIKFGAALLATAVVENSVQAAPAALVAKVSVIAAKGAVVSGSTLALVKGVFHAASGAKYKTPISYAMTGVTILIGGSSLIIHAFLYLFLILMTVFAERHLIKRWHCKRHPITIIFCGACLGGFSTLFCLILNGLIHGDITGEPPGTVWGVLVTGSHLAYSGLLECVYAILPATITYLIYRRLRR